MLTLKRSMPICLTPLLLAGLLLALAACTEREAPPLSPTEQATVTSRVATEPDTASPSETEPARQEIVPPPQPYLAFDSPVPPRATEPTPPVEVFDDGRIVMQMGDFEAVSGMG